MDDTLTIQEAATASGLSEHTLRYYERIGLIAPIGRADNGHRRYSHADLGWLDFLKCLRATGMPIEQMKRYTDLQRVGPATLEDRLDLLADHREAVLAEIEALQDYLAVIEHKIAWYTGEKEKQNA